MSMLLGVWWRRSSRRCRWAQLAYGLDIGDEALVSIGAQAIDFARSG